MMRLCAINMVHYPDRTCIASGWPKCFVFPAHHIIDNTNNPALYHSMVSARHRHWRTSSLAASYRNAIQTAHATKASISKNTVSLRWRALLTEEDVFCFLRTVSAAMESLDLFSGKFWRFLLFVSSLDAARHPLKLNSSVTNFFKAS